MDEDQVYFYTDDNYQSYDLNAEDFNTDDFESDYWEPDERDYDLSDDTSTIPFFDQSIDYDEAKNVKDEHTRRIIGVEEYRNLYKQFKSNRILPLKIVQDNEKHLISEGKELQDPLRRFFRSAAEENISSYNDFWEFLCLKAREVSLSAENQFVFDGFHHHADFETFLDIMKSRKLCSRNYLCSLGKAVPDVSAPRVQSKASFMVKDSVRFYFGSHTPTYYRNEGIQLGKYQAGNIHVPIPVALVFGKDILLKRGIMITDGDASYSDGPTIIHITPYLKEAPSFDWEKIFHRGKLPEEKSIKNTIIMRRCAEVLIPDYIETSYLEKIIFRSQADLKNAVFYLGNDSRYSVDSKSFEPGNSKRNFLKDYSIQKLSDGYKIYLEFAFNADLYEHEFLIYRKGTLEPEKYLFSVKGNKSVVKINIKDINKIEHCEYRINHNISAIWRDSVE